MPLGDLFDSAYLLLPLRNVDVTSVRPLIAAEAPLAAPNLVGNHGGRDTTLDELIRRTTKPLKDLFLGHTFLALTSNTAHEEYDGFTHSGFAVVAVLEGRVVDDAGVVGARTIHITRNTIKVGERGTDI